MVIIKNISSPNKLFLQTSYNCLYSTNGTLYINNQTYILLKNNAYIEYYGSDLNIDYSGKIN